MLLVGQACFFADGIRQAFVVDTSLSIAALGLWRQAKDISPDFPSIK